ncbi:MAG: hypothetical protein II363_03765 [Clostridia bacterium]|nr:hypothetical protein [Clostridia bacterium]
MTMVTLIVVLAVTVEALVEYGKTWFTSITQGGWKTAVIQTGALAVSVLLCIATEADMFQILGISLGNPLLGSVFTALLTARGSNYMADFLTRLTKTGNV